MKPEERHVKIRVIFLGKRRMDAGWPYHMFDVDSEAERLRRKLEELTPKVRGISFFGWDVLSEEGEVSNLAWSLNGADGLLIILLTSEFAALGPDIFKILDSGLPAIVYSSPFSTYWNGSGRLVFERRKAVVVETEEVKDLLPALRALKAVCLLKKMKALIIKDFDYDPSRVDPRMAEPRWMGPEHREMIRRTFGASLVFASFSELLDAYNSVSQEDGDKIAEERASKALEVKVSMDDLKKAARMYLAIKKLMEKYNANAVSVACLEAIRQDVLPIAPCLALSMLNDEGIPASCEADVESLIMLAIVHYLTDRAGFQGDPVVDQASNSLLVAHCTAATKLNGYSESSLPFSLVTHTETWRNVGVKTYMPEDGEATIVGLLTLILSLSTAWPIVMSGAKSIGYILYADSALLSKNPYVKSERGCRTKIALKLKVPLEEFSDNFYGHHRVIVTGDWKRELYMVARLLGIRFSGKPFLKLNMDRLSYDW